MNASVSDSGGSKKVETGGLFAKSSLEISVAVYNKRTKKWEKPNLKEDEKAQIKNALETIRFRGEKEKNVLGRILNTEGAVLEISKDRILDKKKNWTDVLSDRSVNSQTRKEVKKTIHSVTSVLGELSKTKEKLLELDTSATESELNQYLKKKDMGEVVIEVRVVSTAEAFKKELEKQIVFNGDIHSLSQYVESDEWSTYLTENNFDLEKLKTKYESLRLASEHLTQVAQTVSDLLNEGRNEEAYQYYTEHMPFYYESYCEALRDWYQEGAKIRHLTGDEHVFHFPALASTAFHLSAGLQLMYWAEKEFPERFDTQFISKRMSQIYKSHENYFTLVQIAYKEVNSLIKEEDNFLKEIDLALEELDPQNEGFIQKLTDSGFTHEEIANYRMKLQTLRDQLSQEMEKLNKGFNKFSEGRIEEGIQEYTTWINESGEYINALQDLVIFQQIANGRIQGIKCFSLDLNRAAYHEKFLKKLSHEVKEHPVLLLDGTKRIDEGTWTDALSDLEGIQEVFKDYKTPTQFSHFINEVNERFRGNIEKVGQFIHLYQSRRPLLEAMMREQGYSDLDTAYIFNSVVHFYDQLKQIQPNLQKIADLANGREYGEAMEAYGTFMKDHYLPVLNRNADFLLVESALTRIEPIFKNFLSQNGIQGSYQIYSTLLGFGKLFSNIVLDFSRSKSLFMNLTGTEEFPDSITTAEIMVSNTVDSANRFEKQKQLYVVNDAFSSAFQFEGIGNDRDWKRILKTRGWTEKEIREFSTLSNQYSKVIEPFYRAQKAIDMEVDPEKKRMLKSQLRLLAQKNIPKVNRIHAELNRLGGIRKLRSLQLAAQEFIALKQAKTSIVIDEVWQHISEHYEANQKAYGALGITSPEEVVSKLEISLNSLPPKIRESTQAFFSPILQEMQIVKIATGLPKALKEATELIIRKEEFVSNIYESVHLTQNWQFGSVEGLLLTGLHAKDTRFKDSLNAHQWNGKKISAFSRVYDSYIQAYQPLYLAKAVLDEDPHNLSLQEEFNRVYDEQMPQLNKYAKKITEMGGIKAIKSLEESVTQYMVFLNTDLEMLNIRLSTTPTDQVDIDRKNAILTSLRMLKKVNFSEILNEKNAWVSQIAREAPLAMSWEEKYLKPLSDKKSFFYAKIKEKSFFQKQLDLEGLKSQDLTNIGNLHIQYTKELKDLHLLERQLEADPMDRETRIKLVKACRHKRLIFENLEKKYNALEEKIKSLDSAIGSFQKRLIDVLSEIERKEKEIAEADSSNKELLIHNLEVYRKNNIGNTSIEEIRSLINNLEKFYIEDAFYQKRKIFTDAQSQVQYYS